MSERRRRREDVQRCGQVNSVITSSSWRNFLSWLHWHRREKKKSRGAERRVCKYLTWCSKCAFIFAALKKKQFLWKTCQEEKLSVVIPPLWVLLSLVCLFLQSFLKKNGLCCQHKHSWRSFSVWKKHTLVYVNMVLFVPCHYCHNQAWESLSSSLNSQLYLTHRDGDRNVGAHIIKSQCLDYGRTLTPTQHPDRQD